MGGGLWKPKSISYTWICVFAIGVKAENLFLEPKTVTTTEDVCLINTGRNTCCMRVKSKKGKLCSEIILDVWYFPHVAVPLRSCSITKDAGSCPDTAVHAVIYERAGRTALLLMFGRARVSTPKPLRFITPVNPFMNFLHILNIINCISGLVAKTFDVTDQD